MVKLLVVVDDPIFRVGFRACLREFPDIEIGAEVETDGAAMEHLQAAVADPADGTIDLVLLDLDLGGQTGQPLGLSLCQRIKARYPQLPVLLINAVPDPTLLAMAFQTGANGYCSRGTAIADLVAAMERVAVGQSAWGSGLQVMAEALTPNPVPSLVRNDIRLPRFVLSLGTSLRRSGLRQIEEAIAQIDAQLSQGYLSPWERAVLAGQRRELRASRWLVARMLPHQETTQATLVDRSPPELPLQVPPPSIPPSPPPLTTGMMTGTDDLRAVQTALFDRAFARIQSSLTNLTDIPLEIDILRIEKRRELLYLILRQLEATLDELRLSQVLPEQLAEKRAVVLHDLWHGSTENFFGKYYTLRLGQRDVPVVSELVQDGGIVQVAILDKIPQVTEFFACLLFRAPLTIDNVPYPSHTPEALERAEALLENLMLQVANGVVQPLLNRFANVEEVKQGFYDRRLLSTREIERFRNDLSWKYRSAQWFGEPQAIFESRFPLLVLDDRGIRQITIYAPRNQELANLSGVQYVVTLALEARDALAPRVRSTFSFLGSGVVYLLTEVVGRGIGLIGRGIIKGIGNALQDSKLSRDSER